MLRLEEVLSAEAVSIIRSSLIEEPCSMDEMVQGIQAVRRIQELERPKRKELEALAQRIVLDNFPVFMSNEAIISVKAELVDELPRSNLNRGTNRDQELLDEYRKRKLANMFIQGAGLSTHGIHHIDDEFRSKNEELVGQYDLVDKLNMRSMRTIPDEVIMGMSERQMGPMLPNGVFRLEYTNGTWIVNAQATIMPVLIHEIIKGMYELLAMYGLPKDYDVSKRVMAYTDTTKNEFMDMKYGGAVYGMVRDFIRTNFHTYTDKRPEILEYYFQELYEKPPNEMISIVDDIIMGKMDPKHIKSTIEDIYRDIERDEREKNNRSF
jgi:hypothetical protein